MNRKAVFTVILGIAMWTGIAVAAEFDAPWRDSNTSIILDPYHGNDLDYDKLAADKKVIGIIHQATQGLTADKAYIDRRDEALKRGYLWGAYHLLTVDDVHDQISFFLKTVGRHADHTYALDIECVVTENGLKPDGSLQCDPKYTGVTVAESLQAIDEFNSQFGFYPLLYMNDNVLTTLKAALAAHSQYKDIRIWYARFKNDISGVFPTAHWKTYTLWQFSSELTCAPIPHPCAYRAPGTDYKMDVNVYNGGEGDLRRAWPLSGSR